MNKEKKDKYYSIRASVMWLGVILCVVSILCVAVLLLGERSGFHPQTVYAEHGTITSELRDKEKCYLCGTSDDSMMDYYRKFDTIGIIGLNQWHILDLSYTQEHRVSMQWRKKQRKFLLREVPLRKVPIILVHLMKTQHYRHCIL